ncbi:hypothetical protein PybrP1_007099 [[Pythium] brassicae (nom. inval.)]|nr:hypothetical protein PybrP1_007099 [[Pythium] brassicae (nom. inval.)]
MNARKKPLASAPRSERQHTAALALLALAGVLLLFFRARELPHAAANEAAELRPLAHANIRSVDKPATRVVHKSDAPAKSEPKWMHPVAPVAPPHTKTLAELSELSVCERERGLALIDVIRASGSKFCAAGGGDTTKVTLFDVRGGIKSAVFENLHLDLTDAKIHRPIKDLSQDGSSHDPRFVFHPNLLRCRCGELASRAKATPPAPLKIWETALARVNTKRDPAATICDPALRAFAPPKPSDEGVVEFTEPVVLISRRDDHNPFFQVSNALNGWIMVKALGWDLAKTRVVHFDAGFPSPVDALHQKLLSPSFELVRGDTLMGKRVHFKGEVLLSPWEVSGPMMQHLNDKEPCYSSQLLKDFRRLALMTMGVPTAKTVVPVDTGASVVTVTVITRRPYMGRKVQRVWRNEDEIVSRMRAEYADLHVAFESVEFVDLTLQKQMEVVVNSDVVIGMHGAGMVNVLWARPGMLVVEIFPKERRRWGYRNLCQFLDCDWREFRGGADVGGKPKDANSKDKTIPYSEWKAFFDEPFRTRYAQVQERETDLAE